MYLQCNPFYINLILAPPPPQQGPLPRLDIGHLMCPVEHKRAPSCTYELFLQQESIKRSMKIRIQEINLHRTGNESIALSGVQLEACNCFKLFLQLVSHYPRSEVFPSQ